MVVSDDDRNDEVRRLVAMLTRKSNPMRRAWACRKLSDIGWSQARIAAEGDVSQSIVSKWLSLLHLPPDIQSKLARGEMRVSDVSDRLKRRPDLRRTSPFCLRVQFEGPEGKWLIKFSMPRITPENAAELLSVTAKQIRGE